MRTDLLYALRGAQQRLNRINLHGGDFRRTFHSHGSRTCTAGSSTRLNRYCIRSVAQTSINNSRILEIIIVQSVTIAFTQRAVNGNTTIMTTRAGHIGRR